MTSLKKVRSSLFVLFGMMTVVMAPPAYAITWGLTGPDYVPSGTYIVTWDGMAGCGLDYFRLTENTGQVHLGCGSSYSVTSKPNGTYVYSLEYCVYEGELGGHYCIPGDDVTVVVGAYPQAVLHNFGFSDSTIYENEIVGAYWESSYATYCSYTQAPGVQFNPQGPLTIPASNFDPGSYTFTFSCTGTGGTSNSIARTLTVLAALPDQDQDRVPDACETTYGLNPNSSSDGNMTDTDGDGTSNSLECEMGTSPIAFNAPYAPTGQYLIGFDEQYEFFGKSGSDDLLVVKDGSDGNTAGVSPFILQYLADSNPATPFYVINEEPTQAQANTFTTHLPNVQYTLSDYNVDNSMDMMINGLAGTSINSGRQNLIIFADALSDSPPLAMTEKDAEFNAIFNQVGGFLRSGPGYFFGPGNLGTTLIPLDQVYDGSYFSNSIFYGPNIVYYINNPQNAAETCLDFYSGNPLVTTLLQWVLGNDDASSWVNYVLALQECAELVGLEPANDSEFLAQVPVIANYHPDAIRIMEAILKIWQGNYNLGGPQGALIAEVLEDILGVPVLGGVLNSGSPVNDQVGQSRWYRLVGGLVPVVAPTSSGSTSLSPYVELAEIQTCQSVDWTKCKVIRNWRRDSSGNINGVILTDEDSGMDAAVYRHHDTAELILVFRGSDELIDWIVNFLNAFHLPTDQYAQARNASFEAQRVNKALGYATLRTLGHSLGGGLASDSAMQFTTNPAVSAVTFNSAGAFKSGRSDSDVIALYSTFDVLSFAQDYGGFFIPDFVTLPKAVGTRIPVPNGGGHKIYDLCKSMGGQGCIKK